MSRLRVSKQGNGDETKLQVVEESSVQAWPADATAVFS